MLICERETGVIRAGYLLDDQHEPNRSCDRYGRFCRYEWLEPSSDIGTLLDEIDRDPTGVFWG